MNDQESSIEIVVNGATLQVVEGSTLESLIGQLKLSPQQLAIEVNRQLVPRGRHPLCRLNAGDTLEIVTLAGGG